jgi:hypothetical protein
VSVSSERGKIITLDRVYRQRENQFLDILHEIRLGEVSEPTKRFLCDKVIHDLRRKKFLDHQEQTNQRRRSPDDPSDLYGDVDGDVEASETSIEKPTKLFGYNRHVEEYNTTELNKLSAESVIFACKDWGFNESFKNQLKNGSRLPERLELKIGAEVSHAIAPLCSSITVLGDFVVES